MYLSPVEKTETPNVIAMRMPHRRIFKAVDRIDQKAESPLGGLSLNGFISDEEYRAGKRYAEIVQAYRSQIGAPNPAPPSIAGVFEPKHAGRLRDHSEDERLKAKYDDAFEAVSRAGHRAAVAVARVAVHNEACPTGYFHQLRGGLKALAVHFGLTPGRKSALTRNA